jgi:ACS family D-galactonate transporter-like MFS transporter
MAGNWLQRNESKGYRTRRVTLPDQTRRVEPSRQARTARLPPANSGFGVQFSPDWSPAGTAERAGFGAPMMHSRLTSESEYFWGEKVVATSLDAARRTSVQWRIFVLILLIVAINYVDRTSLSVAMLTISKEFGIDAAAQGIILRSFFWTYALVQIPGGWLADRYLPRLMIAGSTILWGAVQALAALATGWVGLLLARLGLGLAEGPILPAGAKLNAVWLPARERGRGAVIIDGGGPLGTAFGGLIIAALIGAFDSWRTAFVVAGLGTIAAGLIAYWYIRDNPREQPSTNEAEAQYIEREHAKEDELPTAGQAGRTNVLDFLRFRSFWGMLLGYVGFDLVWYGMVCSPGLPTILRKHVI